MSENRAIGKKLCVAAVQMGSRLGRTRENLALARSFAAKAAKEGAKIIVAPELAASGYSMSKAVWDAAESRDGATVRWAREVSQTLGAYVGIGFVEADGPDYYNSYVLGAPDGRVACIVRKTMAETYCFRCERGEHTIRTDLGRVGVGICADTHFAPLARLMQSQAVDLMIMPHAWPGAFKVGGAVSRKDIEQSTAKASGMASLYARILGAPAVFANLVGPMGSEKWSGILGSMLKPDAFRLYGLSTIADSDGSIRACMDGEKEGFIVAEVTLDPAGKREQAPERYGSYGGGWLHPIASPLVDVICGLDAFVGRASYRVNRARRTRKHGARVL
jgi:N-carbamoylputrescine amidase